jgi:hypothetical protein
VQAAVAPVFKKDNGALVTNYIITCFAFKMPLDDFESIIYDHISLNFKFKPQPSHQVFLPKQNTR